MENNTKMTKKEFYKDGLDKATKNNIKTGGIIFYIATAATLLTGVVSENVAFVIADVVICLILGLAIHIGKSRVASVIALVYGVASVIIALVNTGALAGWLLPIGGICATIGTFKAAKAWKEYEKSGIEAPDFTPESFTIPEQVNAIEEGDTEKTIEG